MVGLRKRGERIRQFILRNTAEHPNDIAALTAKKFGITRQAVNRHLQLLVKQEAILSSGNTRNRQYRLHPLVKWQKSFALDGQLEEDVIWRQELSPLLEDLPSNVQDIWHYGVTEMLNNAIDHSSSNSVNIGLTRTAVDTEILISDGGVGIFKKIQTALGLEDERHSVLELAKGKLTTDPENHTGEGIFFSSRMFDRFAILSGGVYFSHEFVKIEDWIMEEMNPIRGTAVFMNLNHHTARTLKSVFDQFTTGEDYQFSKTIVPVKLVQYGDERLVSRSQAKRLLSRVDRFRVVIFDFADVNSVGQAFTDEIFRVFRNRHPEIEIHSVNINKTVGQLISRATKDE